MTDDYVLLTEKEAMWAEMLTDVLKNSQIPYVSQPVYGAGFTLKTGTQERFRIYTPEAYKNQAEALLLSLFPSENP